MMDKEALSEQLSDLRAEHRALDDQIGQMLGVLDAISDAEIARMQARGRRVWEEHLRPGAANATFYDLLRRRVYYVV